MKAKWIFLPVAAVLAVGTGVYLYYFGGPYRFVERPLAGESLQHLRSIDGHLTPANAGFEYMYWWPNIDRPNRAKLEIRSTQSASDEAIVTIIDNDCQSDSVWRTCDRLTLHRVGNSWVPVKHQAAWMGRGRFGWTTEPCL